MAYMASMMNGARLALAVGFTLSIVNGVWARFNPSGNTLRQSVVGRLGGNAHNGTGNGGTY